MGGESGCKALSNFRNVKPLNKNIYQREINFQGEGGNWVEWREGMNGRMGLREWEGGGMGSGEGIDWQGETCFD